MTNVKQCLLALAALLAVAHPASAQQKPQDEKGFTDTFATINTARWYVANGWTNGDHQSCEWRADANRIVDHKLVMTLSEKGGKLRPIGCSELHTNAKLGHGRFEARLRTAAGSGLNTALFSYTGPPAGNPEWDEIDFEFLGKDPTKVDINHTANHQKIIGKVVDLGFDASKDFHEYAFDWSESGIVWYADGKEIHRTPPGVPLPRNPAAMFLSVWSGSDVVNPWLGKFTFQKPVTAEVVWARYTPHTK